MRFEDGEQTKVFADLLLQRHAETLADWSRRSARCVVIYVAGDLGVMSDSCQSNSGCDVYLGARLISANYL